MKVNLEELNKRVEQGYIRKQAHNEYPLIIWNYTERCAFDNIWDEYTLMARGLITDLDGNIVAFPFKKFFNVGQTEETMVEKLPACEPDVYEKLDGSLGILYVYDNQLCIATRGSFNSEQAKWATEWIRNHERKWSFMTGWTYLFEIIYPENRIVVDYGDRRELILLGIKSIDDGSEATKEVIELEANRLGLSHAKTYNKKLEELIAECKDLPSSEEGFVLVYPNNFRVKIKGDEYVRLHRLITGFSTKSIWECLKNRQSLDDILVKIPDEFYKWVREKESELTTKAIMIENDAVEAFKEIRHLPTRREQAIEIMKRYKDISGIVFNLLDDKDYHDIIWKMIKPSYELPFKCNVEEV